MGATAGAPKRSAVHMQGGTYNRAGIKLIWASCGVQGVRLSMEDSHICTPFEKGPLKDGFFAGVFDGHGGDETSKAVVGWGDMVPSQSLVDRLAERVQAIDASSAATERGVNEAFSLFDRDWNDMIRGEQDHRSGATGITVAIHDGQVMCMNIGDSRCVRSQIGDMALRGRYRALSNDHKPTNAGEMARIQNAGLTVARGRVNGDLALSRAFGDFTYKTGNWVRPDLGQLVEECKRQAVTVIPEVMFDDWTKIDILLLACDGVWDVMNNSGALSLVQHLINVAPQGATPVDTLKNVVHLFINAAIDLRSMDNVSATIILRLPDASDPQMQYNNLLKPGERITMDEMQQLTGLDRSEEIQTQRRLFAQDGVQKYYDAAEKPVERIIYAPGF